MKDVIKKMIDHPIISVVLVREVSYGVARVVRAFKGVNVIRK